MHERPSKPKAQLQVVTAASGFGAVRCLLFSGLLKSFLGRGMCLLCRFWGGNPKLHSFGMGVIDLSCFTNSYTWGTPNFRIVHNCIVRGFWHQSSMRALVPPKPKPQLQSAEVCLTSGFRVDGRVWGLGAPG